MFNSETIPVTFPVVDAEKAPNVNGTFADLNLHPQLASRIKAAGYENPTPIQAQAIPLVMDGADLFGLAQTGTGKTAAFVLPILHKYLTSTAPRVKTPTTLILCPTRELADQVLEVVKQFSKRKRDSLNCHLRWTKLWRSNCSTTTRSRCFSRLPRKSARSYETKNYQSF